MNIHSVLFHVKHPWTIQVENKPPLVVNYRSVHVLPIFASCLATLAYFGQPNRKTICAVVATGLTTFYVVTAIAKRTLLKQQLTETQPVETIETPVVTEKPKEEPPLSSLDESAVDEYSYDHKVLLPPIESFDFDKLYSIINKRSKVFLFLEILEKELPGKVFSTTPRNFIDPEGGDEWLPAIKKRGSDDPIWNWILEIPFLWHDVRFAHQLFACLSDKQFDGNMIHLNAKYPSKLIEWLKWERYFWKEKIDFNPDIFPLSKDTFTIPPGADLHFAIENIRWMYTTIQASDIKVRNKITSNKKLDRFLDVIRNRELDESITGKRKKGAIEDPQEKYYQQVETKLIQIAFIFGNEKLPIIEKYMKTDPLSRIRSNNSRNVMLRDLEKIMEAPETCLEALCSIIAATSLGRKIRFHLDHFSHTIDVQNSYAKLFSLSNVLEQMDKWLNSKKTNEALLSQIANDWMHIDSLTDKEREDEQLQSKLQSTLKEMMDGPPGVEKFLLKMEEVRELFKKLGKPLPEKHNKTLLGLFDEGINLTEQSRSQKMKDVHYNEKAHIWEKEGIIKMLLHPSIGILKKG